MAPADKAASVQVPQQPTPAALDASRGLVYQGPRSEHPRCEDYTMAIDPSGGHPAMDYPEHLRTYSGFIKGMMLMITFVVLVLLFLLHLVP
jgi:hypothetical protein